MASGLVIASEAFVDLPNSVALSAAVCFLAGAVLSGFASVLAGRRAGIGPGRAVGQGIADGFRWLFKFMP
jgi:hypothetical protein